MTREEQIVEAAKAKEEETGFCELVKSPVSRGVDSACGIGFIEGAVWADEHPINYDGKAMLHVLNKGAAIGRREMLDKACEWLEQRQLVDLEVPNIEKFINDFRKDMEEQ